MGAQGPFQQLMFYASRRHACSYLAGRQSVLLFADPYAAFNPQVYAHLAEMGFRRSGEYIYRPACPGCNECVSVRIDVAQHRPSRSERRILRRNADLDVAAVPPVFRDEHYALYTRYVRARHPHGGMDEASPRQYLSFLKADWSQTRFYEFRLAGELLAVAVVDAMEQGLSAVYTFFDPTQPQRSLGTYAVLREIAEARRLELKWLYLGYWIRGCEKMSYKARFAPLEAFRNGRWGPIQG